ncbi:hypothetical protein VVMO6_00138 [Vibrio vulnificus MO6-24/O]|nr:hypothetical protein VVMO6_00138 [Vibrio vulnificus MO6-24/O]
MIGPGWRASERMQPTPLQLQVGRVYNKGIPWMPLFFFFCATNAK